MKDFGVSGSGGREGRYFHGDKRGHPFKGSVPILRCLGSPAGFMHGMDFGQYEATRAPATSFGNQPIMPHTTRFGSEMDWHGSI